MVVLVPSLVLAVVVSDVGTRSPIGREVVAIPDGHVVVLDHIAMLHLVVRPGPPAPHGNCRFLHGDGWFVHDLAWRDRGRDGTAVQVCSKYADEARPQHSFHCPLLWRLPESRTDAARPITICCCGRWPSRAERWFSAQPPVAACAPLRISSKHMA